MLELNFDFAVQPYTKFNLRMEIEKLRISSNLVLKYASYLRIFFRFTGLANRWQSEETVISFNKFGVG